MEIINEEKIKLYGKEYNQITYSNGEQILKRYNKKTKMWVTLKFAKSFDENLLNELSTLIVNAL